MRHNNSYNLTPNDKAKIRETFQKLRSEFDSDRETFEAMREVLPFSRGSFQKYGVTVMKDGELTTGFYNFVPNQKIELDEIGRGAKIEFVPETSDDYEITPPRDKKREAINELPDMPQLSPNGERWLILPDIHVPYHDLKSITAVLEYASEIRWDGLVMLGDFMDWDFCSRWSVDNARKIAGKRFLYEYDAANIVLDLIEKAVRNKNKNAKITLIEGNHDWRVENVIDKTPSLEGLIEMRPNLFLDRRKIDYWRYWTHRRAYVIGKAWFIHGEYIGSNHAKKIADNFHRNVFYGHTHDRMGFTKTTVSDDSVFCESFGTLSLLELEYMGRKPSNWVQTFAEFFFNGDGTFNHYVTNIVDHKFTAINGQRYGAK